MQKIPLKQVPSQKIRVVLGGQNCTISVYYRFGATYMDLYVGNMLIEQGAVCRNRASIIRVASAYFMGSLHFLDLRGDDEPNYHLFNDRFILLFVAANEDPPAGLRY